MSIQSITQRQIVAELDALQAEVDALKRLQAETAAEEIARMAHFLSQGRGMR